MKPIYICAPFVLALSIACLGQTVPSSVSVPDDSVSGVAAVRLSVDEAVVAALESNPEIRAAVRRLSLAQMKTNTARILDDPMLMVLLHIPKWPRLFGAVSPTANARHLVVGSPIREGIIGGMNYDEAAAIAHVLLEMCLQYDASFWVVNRPVLLTSLGLAPETANSTASLRAETPSAQLGSHPGRRD